MTVWAMRMMVRFGARSAIEPPQSANGISGIKPMALITPSATAEPVRR